MATQRRTAKSNKNALSENDMNKRANWSVSKGAIIATTKYHMFTVFCFGHFVKRVSKK
jgi:hypothetical protein